MRFQPGLDRFFAFDAGKFVFEFRGLQHRANLFLALGQKPAVLGSQRGGAPRVAQTLQTIAQRSCGTACRGRRVVQFVRESSGQFSKCCQLFSLLLFPGDVSNAVGQQPDETLREFGHALKKLRKMSGGKRQGPNGKHGTPSHSKCFHSRKRQDPCNIPGPGCKDGPVLRAVLAPGPHFTLEHHHHGVSRSAFRDCDSPDFDTALLRLGNKTFQIVLGLVCERGHFTQIGNKSFQTSSIRRCAHWTFAKYWCMNCTTTAPSPTPEATRLTEPWRTSPTTKIPGTLVSSKPGSRSRVQDVGLFPFRSKSGPERMKPRSSRSIVSPSHSVRGCAPMNMKRLVAGSFFLSPEGEHSTVIPVSRVSPCTSTTLVRGQTSMFAVFSICSIK